MLLVVGSPGLRRASARPARRARSCRAMRARSRPTGGRSSSATASCGRSARRAPGATSCGSGTTTFLDAGGADRGGPAALLGAPRGATGRAHAEIAPDEAAAATLTLRYATNAPAAAGETPRDALARRLVETADKEVWNGATLVGPHRDDLVVRAGRPGPGRVRVARPAADGDPLVQARRARPADRAGRAAAAPAPRRRLLRARPGPPRAPRPAHRGPAPGLRDDDDARRPRPGAAGDRDELGGPGGGGRRAAHRRSGRAGTRGSGP